MKHVGFSGTQRGMTVPQVRSLAILLSSFDEFVGHHGDCVGSDSQFDQVCRLLPNFVSMVIHPANLDARRANCTVGPKDVLRPTRAPLVRNQDIADETSVLVATPKESSMVTRSGTWTTVRMGVAAGSEVWVIVPTGSVLPWRV